MFCMDASWIIRSLTTVMDCGTSRSSVSVFVALRVRAGAYVSSASCVSADTWTFGRVDSVLASAADCGSAAAAASSPAARAEEASANAVITAKAMGFTAERVERVVQSNRASESLTAGLPFRGVLNLNANSSYYDFGNTACPVPQSWSAFSRSALPGNVVQAIDWYWSARAARDRPDRPRRWPDPVTR